MNNRQITLAACNAVTVRVSMKSLKTSKFSLLWHSTLFHVFHPHPLQLTNSNSEALKYRANTQFAITCLNFKFYFVKVNV